MTKEPRVFSVMDKEGAIKRLVEAQNVKEVKAFLLADTLIDEPSTHTVAKLMEGGMRIERAA